MESILSTRSQRRPLPSPASLGARIRLQVFVPAVEPPHSLVRSPATGLRGLEPRAPMGRRSGTRLRTIGPGPMRKGGRPGRRRPQSEAPRLHEGRVQVRCEQCTRIYGSTRAERMRARHSSASMAITTSSETASSDMTGPSPYLPDAGRASLCGWRRDVYGNRVGSRSEGE